MNGLGERARKPLDRRADRPDSRRSARPKAGAAVAAPAEASFASAARATQVEIDSDDAGQRIDNYLFRRAKGVPKSHLYRIVRGGELRVNGKRVDADYRLVAGDVLRVPPMRVADRTATDAAGRAAMRERAVDLVVVHEDDDLLVVDKPVGVAVHGGSGISFGVIEQLRAARPDARFLELIHRLDRDTSGLLMIAKKRSALVAVHEQLRDGQVRKHYLACVAGAWPEAKRQIKLPLVKITGADGERRVRVAVRDDPDGMPAHTIVRRVEVFETVGGAFALVDVELRTGRTHQIRVHLSHLGRPIVGDDKYGDHALNKQVAARASATPLAAGFRRMFLHAASLELTHPRSGATLALAAPMPAECVAFVEALRHAAVRVP